MSKLSTTTKYEPQNQDWAKQMLHEQKTQDSAFSEPKTPVPNPPDKVFGKRGPRKSTNPPNEKPVKIEKEKIESPAPIIPDELDRKTAELNDRIDIISDKNKDLTIALKDKSSEVTLLQDKIRSLADKNNELIRVGKAQDDRFKAIKDSIKLHQVEVAISRALAWRHRETGFNLYLWYKPPTETDHGLLGIDQEFPGEDWRKVISKQVPKDDVGNLRELIMRFIIDSTSGLAFAPVPHMKEKAIKPIYDDEDEGDEEED